MKLTKLISAASLITMTIGTGIQASAATYGGPRDATSSVTAEITVPPVDPDNPEIPPIDPENPENPPVDPGETNPERGDGLSIRYVSSLDFGSTNFSVNPQHLTANLDSGLENQEFENMVTVEDIRGDRDGWTLTVRQMGEFANGSTITMNPYVHENSFGVVTTSGKLILTTEDKIFAEADNHDADAGVISMGMGTVTLDIPAGTGVGEYVTSLMWNLTNGPV
ncbi:WxL domain-containing protein [Enterococcus casseliflavus]|nr:WxL domain-containing protein [Enterococcus casseliflavus]